MIRVWILAEQFERRIADISFELLARALKLDYGEVGALLIGPPLAESELRRLNDAGAALTVAYESMELTHFRIEPHMHCFAQFVGEYQPEIILAGATPYGRTLMPYAAMRLHTGLTADCTELAVEPDTGLLLQTRPAIGGNIMATIKCPVHRPQMATVRPHSTAPARPGEAAGDGGRIVRIAADRLPESGMKIAGFEPFAGQLNLSDAKRVVVVGRGIKKAENLPMIFELAEALGAAVGASREVVDRGWLGYQHQIGLSGKTVSPEFYLGIGVSGAIQHLAGMQNAGRIMAVNKDPEAGIFKVADFGLVGDLFEIVPELTRQLRQGGTSWLNTAK